MTTAARPDYGHGTRACYVRGCRRDECRAANYRYMCRARLDRHRGQPRRVPSTQTRAHIERLLAAGWTQAKIARAAGLYHRSIGGILAGQPTIANRTALAILNIPIGPPPADDRDVDATGTVRRIRALIAIGYPGAHIAKAIGMHHDALNKIARGEMANVRATTATTVARVYRQLSLKPGPSARARELAAKNGWHGPMAWDAIDDPAAQPEVDLHADKRGRTARIDDTQVAHLTDEGLSAEQIAWELGCHERTVKRARSRARDMAQAA